MMRLWPLGMLYSMSYETCTPQGNALMSIRMIRMYYTIRGHNILLGRAESDGSEVTSISLYWCLHSPGSLHKAAGLLYENGWNTKGKDIFDDHPRFIDPMAGSGSLVLEAMIMMNDIAPGLMRIHVKLQPVTQWKSNTNSGSIKGLWKKLFWMQPNELKLDLNKILIFMSMICFMNHSTQRVYSRMVSIAY